MDPFATSHISNVALRHEVKTGAANDCKSTAVLLSRLGEFDARKLYLEDGYPSMYTYCLHELHFCEGTASWRIYAARAARRFPVLFDAVADGRLHLTAVVMLRKYLTSGNVEALVEAATHKSREEIAKLIANRFPRRDLPERLEAIPAPLAPAGPPVAQHWPANAPEEIPSNIPPGPGPTPMHPVNVHAGDNLTTSWSDQHWPANVPAPAPRAKVAPLAPERFGLQVTVDQETYDLLQQARALMSHQNPGGEIAPVLKSALRLLVAQLEKRKFAAASRPRQVPKRHAGTVEEHGTATRHIPAEVKRAVRERDEGRCTFVSEGGKRCGSRTLLEYDHVEPLSSGGKSTADNVRLRCRAHNQYAAEQAFGVEFMDQKRRTARDRPRSAGGSLAPRAG